MLTQEVTTSLVGDAAGHPGTIRVKAPLWFAAQYRRRPPGCFATSWTQAGDQGGEKITEYIPSVAVLERA